MPANQYAQMLMGKIGWGTREHVERTTKREYKIFQAGSSSGLATLREGTYSPQPAAAVSSPDVMTALLANPSRRKRFVRRTSPLMPDVPDVVESEEHCAPK